MSERKPLTLEELRKMDGKPVWVECLKPQKYTCPPVGWRILSKAISGRFGVWSRESCLVERDYGTDWEAYDHEPPRLDRSAWEPCGACKTEKIIIHVPAFKAMAVCNQHMDHGAFDLTLHLNFCPYCGRPLTDAAWDMLQKRLEGAK